MSQIKNLLEQFEKKLLADDLSINTIKSYLADVRQFFHWCQELNPDIEIKEISFYNLNAYKDYIIHSKRKTTSSVNRNIQSLRNFFQFLTKKKVLKQNPTSKTKFLRRVRSTKPHSLDKKEVHRLLSAVVHSSHGTKSRNFALLHLFLQTGIRVTELLSLQFRDLEIYQRSGQIRIVDGKGGKERVIPLNNTARRALSSYTKGREFENTEVVFLSKQNKYMTARAIQKTISTLARKAGIKRINVTPHVLRHTFAINYLRANPECLVDLSTLLGHESLDTTAIYTAASKEHLADTVEKTGIHLNE